jgi:carbamoyl-phosphate synthase large subunit
VIKPRTARGSRGFQLLGSDADLRRYLDTSPVPAEGLLLQECIDGPEFTVSVVVWRDAEVQAVVPKEIISKRGITRLAVTRRNAAIDTLCRSIQRALRADGPFNVQLRLRAGVPLPFEVNPRFSTSISLTMAAGIDELCGLVAQALGGRDGYRFGDWREGVVLVRTTRDEFLDERAFRAREIVNMAD